MAGMTETDVTFAVSLEQAIHYSIAGDSGPVAPPALVRAPVEPDAPPLPPGLSAAPVYRPQPHQSPTVTAQTDSPVPTPTATPPTRAAEATRAHFRARTRPPAHADPGGGLILAFSRRTKPARATEAGAALQLSAALPIFSPYD